MTDLTDDFAETEFSGWPQECKDPESRPLKESPFVAEIDYGNGVVLTVKDSGNG